MSDPSLLCVPANEREDEGEQRQSGRWVEKAKRALSKDDWMEHKAAQLQTSFQQAHIRSSKPSRICLECRNAVEVCNVARTNLKYKVTRATLAR